MVVSGLIIFDNNFLILRRIVVNFCENRTNIRNNSIDNRTENRSDKRIDKRTNNKSIQTINRTKIPFRIIK